MSVILSGFTLSDGVTELQNLESIQASLIADIGDLRVLSGELNDNLTAAKEKQGQIQTEKSNYENTKSIALQEKQAKEQLLVVTKNQESAYQKQLAALQDQQNSIADEINKMEQRLKSGLAQGEIPKPMRGLLSWPVEMASGAGTGGIITQKYGNINRSLYGNNPHNGLDIGISIGTPVYASADGIVMRADHNDVNSWKKYQYGTHVLIDHGNGLSTLYAHLARFAVGSGAQVKRGQLIGYSDNTGYSTGSHLHFGVYVTPVGGWKIIDTAPGLIRIPPANGLVPVGATLDPEDYLG